MMGYSVPLRVKTVGILCYESCKSLGETYGFLEGLIIFYKMSKHIVRQQNERFFFEANGIKNGKVIFKL